MIKNILLLSILTILSTNISLAIDDFDIKEICESQQGVWREFGNNCANNCTLNKNQNISCTPSITYSCQCPEESCWDYYQCVNEAQYQIQAQKEEDEEIELIKKENPDLFFDYADNSKVMNRSKEENKSKIKKNEAIKKEQAKEEKEVKEDAKTFVENQMIQCIKSNGSWQEYSNGCADNCFNKQHPSLCSSNPTQACNCGDNRCWNGSSCILTSKY